MIWAWIVTSSAVVGSSAISSSGSLAIAIAIMTRWRMPPDSSCGYARSAARAAGDRDLLQQRDRAPARPARRGGWWAASPRRSARPTVMTGLSDVSGSWKIMAMRLPRIAQRARRGRAAPRRRTRTEPVALAPGEQAEDGEHRHALAASRTRRRCRAAPGADVEVDAAHRVERPVTARELTGRSRTSSSGSLILELGVEVVAQAVAEEVERQHHGEDGDAGAERDPPLVEVACPSEIIEPPLRRRRRGAEADEGQRRGEEHHLAEVHGRVDQDRRHGEREDVADQDVRA